jgi:hypothetical protein
MQFLKQICFGLLTLLACTSASFAQGAYFPSGSFDQLRTRWYTKQLKALEEPSLAALALTHRGESYRFVWLRTFHQPIAIRINVNTDGTSQLTSKMTSGTGGYDPGHLVLNETSTLTKEQTEAFLKIVKDGELWAMPTKEEVIALDGAEWIIELAKDGAYHVVDRWSPSKGPIRKTGLMMVQKLGKLDIPGRIY